MQGKHYTWKFELEKSDYTVDLLVTPFSRKKKLLQNGQVIKSKELKWNIGEISLTILQIDDGFDLQISNFLFSKLLKNLQEEELKSQAEAHLKFLALNTQPT